MDYFLNKNMRKVTSTDNANPFNTKYFYLFLFLIKKIATRRKVFLKKRKEKRKKKKSLSERGIPRMMLARADQTKQSVSCYIFSTSNRVWDGFFSSHRSITKPPLSIISNTLFLIILLLHPQYPSRNVESEMGLCSSNLVHSDLSQYTRFFFWSTCSATVGQGPAPTWTGL